MSKDNPYNDFRSPIPRHLSPEERKKWEKDLEWEKKEYERRQKEGYYPHQGPKFKRKKSVIRTLYNKLRGK